MKMTLRQAHKLVEKINAKIGSIDVSVTREVTPWTVTADTLGTLRAEFDKNMARLFALNAARYAVREQIGVGNRAEVDSLVGERKFLLDQIGVLRTIVAGFRATHVSDAAALVAKAQAQQSAAANGGTSRYSEDTVSVSLLTAADIEGLNSSIDELQLKIEEIEDRLTSANASRDGAIILSDAVLVTLRQEGLIK